MKSGTKVLIVALIVMMLALAIAYASFNGVLKVSGKADASGKFEVVFTNGLVSTADHGTAKIDATDGTKMTATVKNNGTVPAKLTGFNLYNKGTTTSFSNNDIEVLIPNLDTSGSKVLESGESTTISFTVKWKKDSTAKSATAEFDIELDYEQATEEITGTASDVNTKN